MVLQLIRKSILPVFLLFLASTTILESKTVLFKDGSMIRGEIIDQDQFRIQLQTPDGEVQSIPKDNILKIHYKDFLTSDEEAAIRKEELDAERRKVEMADLYSRAITPLPQELSEIAEREINPIENPYSKTTAEGAFFRSLVAPGWGQFYQGRHGAGYFFTGMMLGGGAVYYRQNQIYRSAVKDLKRLENPYSNGEILASFLGLGNLPTSEDILASSEFGNLDNPVEYIIQRELSPVSQQRKSVERHLQTREQIGYGLAFVWLWNALDAYFFHPSYESEPILGFQENLNAKNWTISLDSISLPSAWEARPNVEHRLQFTLFY